MIRKFLLAVVASMGVAVLVAPATAATYNLTFDGPNYDVNALVTTDLANSVVSISGTIIGSSSSASITGVINPPGSPPYSSLWGWDNLLSPAFPFVALGGLLWSNSDGTYANLYSVGTTIYLSVSPLDGSGPQYNPGDIGTLSVVQTPLPSAILLFGSALAGMGFLARRRRVASDARLALTSGVAV